MSYRALTRGDRQQVHGQMSSRFEAHVINTSPVFLVMDGLRHGFTAEKSQHLIRFD